MRVAIVQTNPALGALERNIQRANDLLEAKFPARSDEKKADLIVLPELALSGYHFETEEDIVPFLETRGTSPSTNWAKEVAQRYRSRVLVGLPMQLDERRRNAAIMVDSRGEVVHEYQKHHLYQTDYEWGCTPGPGFSSTTIELDGHPTKMSVGICMDINPWEFEAPFEAYEYANYILEEDISLVIVPMAWSLPKEIHPESLGPSKPTLVYWVQRLYPLRQDSKKRTVVICNRTGREGHSLYAGHKLCFDHG